MKSEVETKQYHHGNLKAELISVAIEILDVDGIEGLGIRQVARKVGVAHSAPANHFKNKKALLTALATEIFQHLIEEIETLGLHKIQTSLSDAQLRKKVHQFAQVVLEFGLKYPNRYRLICRRDIIDAENPDLYQAMEVVYEKMTTMLRERAQRQNIDVESQAIALWSLIHGYVSLRLEGNLAAGKDAVTGSNRQNAIIDVMLNGLLSSN